MVSSGGELSVSGAVFLTIITTSRLTGSSAVFGILILAATVTLIVGGVLGNYPSNVFEKN